LKKRFLFCTFLSLVICGCMWPPSREVADLSLITQEDLPPEYVREMTSEDPTYAYTLDNPVRVAPGIENQERYLRHLRCPLLEPYFFSRRSEILQGAGGRILTTYDLHCRCRRHAATIYIDGRVIGANPDRQKAPSGMFWHK